MFDFEAGDIVRAQARICTMVVVDRVLFSRDQMVTLHEGLADRVLCAWSDEFGQHEQWFAAELIEHADEAALLEEKQR